MKRWFHIYAEKKGYKINSVMEELIHKGLEAKKKEFGVRFCPCKIDNSIENVCPCKEFRTEGHCHCGLFFDNQAG